MARFLSDVERKLVSTALTNYAAQLAASDKTGIPAVDDIVESQHDNAMDLSVSFAESTRGSVSLPADE